jgi:hypothetical protein
LITSTICTGIRIVRAWSALGVVELLDRADQAQVALLDQVQEQHAAAGVALGQRDDQPQVRLEQVVLGPATVLGDPLVLVADLVLELELLVGDLLLGEQTGLDPLGELDLLLGVQQRDLADLLEIVLDRIRGGAGDQHLLLGLVGVVGVGDDEALVLGELLLDLLLRLGLELRLVDVVEFAALGGLRVDQRAVGTDRYLDDPVGRTGPAGLLGGGLLGRGRLLDRSGGLLVRHGLVSRLLGRGLLGRGLLRRRIGHPGTRPGSRPRGGNGSGGVCGKLLGRAGRHVLPLV